MSSRVEANQRQLTGMRCGRRGLLATVLVASITLASGAARAGGTKHDAGLWLMALAQGSFKGIDESYGDFLWWFDNHARFLDDSDGFEQSIVRPGLGYAVLENLSAWAGYGWIHTNPAGGRNSDEHRVWQQAIWSMRFEPVSLSSRTRLEQRFFEQRSETGWRLREFVKLTYPLPFDTRFGLSFYDEAFFDLNDTEWGADAGFAQNRAFAGVSWSFDEDRSAKLEVGYLNQFVRNRSDDDSMNHILSLNILLSF